MPELWTATKQMNNHYIIKSDHGTQIKLNGKGNRWKTLLVYISQFWVSAESVAPSNPNRAPEEPTDGRFSTKSAATNVPTKAESM